MYSWLAVFLFHFSSILLYNRVVETFDLQSIINDLTEFNISCTDDNCQDYQEDSLSSRACHCGIHCAQLGTCCFDSPYVDVPKHEPKPMCRYVYNTGYYFLVDQCSSTDSVWADLCNNELSEEDNVQELVPVTSLLTNITYKNFFCFRCNEATDEFLYWTLQVKSRYELPTTSEDGSKELDGNISLTYDKRYAEIMASYDEEIGYFIVQLSLQMPSKIKNVTHVCESDVISSCAYSWTDEEVRNKCQSYMALKTVERLDFVTLKYRNVHCALCNYENLTDVYCNKLCSYGCGNKYGGDVQGGWFVGGRGSGYFSYSYVMDINRSDGESVGRIRKCSDDHMWDSVVKKCRKVSCALPGFKIRNWKCVKE